MKLFVLLIALLATLNVALCQLTHPTESPDIQKEVDEIFATYRAQVQSGAEQLEGYAKDRLNKAIQQFVAYSDRIKAALKSYVITEFLTNFVQASEKILANLKKQLRVDNFNVDVNQALSIWEKNLVQPVQDEIDGLKEAVDGNPKAYQCWGDNKNEFRTIFESFVKTVGVSIAEEQKSLDAKLMTRSKLVETEVTAIESSVNNGNTLRTLNYVIRVIIGVEVKPQNV